MTSSVNWTNLSHTLGSLFNFNSSDNSHQVNAVTNACMITYVFQLWPWIAWLLNYSLYYFYCSKKINSLFQFSSCMICQIDFVDSKKKSEHCGIANECIFFALFANFFICFIWLVHRDRESFLSFHKFFYTLFWKLWWSFRRKKV